MDNRASRNNSNEDGGFGKEMEYDYDYEQGTDLFRVVKCLLLWSNYLRI